jgi:multiple sugar transport system permease protein
MRLLQVGLQSFETEVSTNYHLMMAAAMFTMAPIIVLYFFLQRQFIETMASSGVKG